MCAWGESQLKENESQSKLANYRVSCVKPKKHPFRISVLEICVGITLSSSNADPNADPA